MADKRMFSLKIVDSDLFLDMPLSSQCLYFHLSMRADDDGFVDNPKKIIKIIGANEDDLKILITKGFVIVFERGIIVITHWKINNYIRNDRRKETMYITEKQSLTQTENGAYIKLENLGIPNDNQVSTICPHSIGKGRLDKVSIDKGRGEKENQSAPVSFYGEFKNVRLSKEEYKNLKEKLNSHTEIMINKLSRYMESRGKTYQNHYVTILNWYEEDKDKLTQKGLNKKMNYDVGESL
ncbi:replisome organizer [Streptococcus anginosus]|nr:replisome organizer [Streptococcus anginosus]MED5835174.1 replisome organizer [Streptococcus anginosus]